MLVSGLGTTSIRLASVFAATFLGIKKIKNQNPVKRPSPLRAPFLQRDVVGMTLIHMK